MQDIVGGMRCMISLEDLGMALFVFERSIHCQRLRRTHNGQWAGKIEKDSGTLSYQRP